MSSSARGDGLFILMSPGPSQFPNKWAGLVSMLSKGLDLSVRGLTLFVSTFSIPRPVRAELGEQRHRKRTASLQSIHIFIAIQWPC